MRILLLATFIFLLSACGNDNTSNIGLENTLTNVDYSKLNSPTTKFEILKSDVTGINAVNTITQTNVFSYFLWMSIYNGSGVGVADFNNDGLPDVYLGQNMKADAIYKNLGGMKFEDVSEGIPRDVSWTSGVTVVDINNDGLMDIYISKFSHHKDPEKRRNQLLVNQGDFVFKEEARKYGLDDWGYSNMATFFDVDKDGDKDMYIVNQPPDVRYRQVQKPTEEEKRKYYSDRLYIRNKSGRYVDKTEEYGLLNYAPGFNALANDINGDGWLDIYVSNDYEQEDYLYINQGGKKFTLETENRTGHISNFSMGCDIGDVNNDGLNDITTVDMSPSDHYRAKTNMGSMSETLFWQNVNNGYHYQYMFNTLQYNQGDGYFSDIAQMAGVSSSDWSWAVLLEDFNSDGLKDMYITNGIQKDIRNNDFVEDLKKDVMSGKNGFKSLELLPKIPSNPISNFYYQNKNGFEFEQNTKEVGAYDEDFSNGAAVADFDGDGDLDIIVAVSEGSSKILSNTTEGPTTNIRYALDKSLWNEFLNAAFYVETTMGLQRKDIVPTRGYLSSSWDNVYFGLAPNVEAKRAYVKTIYGDTYELPTTTGEIVRLEKSTLTKIDVAEKMGPKFFEQVNDFEFTHKENTYNDFTKEILLPHKLSEEGPSVLLCSNNLFVGGSLGNPLRQFSKSGGKWIEKNQSIWSKHKLNENQDIVPIDIEGDGDEDLYIVNGGNEADQESDSWLIDQLFVNKGDGTYEIARDLPPLARNTSTAEAIDIDSDGDEDLIVFGAHKIGKYPKFYESYILENTNGKFKVNNDLGIGLESLGQVHDAVKIDYNKDGKPDIVVVAAWETPKVLLADGKKLKVDEPAEFSEFSSWWTHVNTVDLNGDGAEDLILGSFGDNNKFHPSKKKPLEIFGSDFDNSGTNDVVLAKHYNNKIVPTRGRECSSQQIPDILEKFPTYNEFALAGIDDILGESNIESSTRKKITNMAHYIVWNNADGWKKEKLSLETQIAPLKSTAILDVNKDGIDDVVGIGNHFGAEVETARYDAGYGWVVLGNKNNDVTYVPPLKTGLNLFGDGRALVSVGKGNNKELLAFFNNDKVRTFKVK